MTLVIKENEKFKIARSENYSFDFNKENGFFARWGKTHKDDPQFSPFGPEILDLEISVNGCPNKCPFCYKGNTNEAPTNMNLETHNKIIDKMGKQLTQVAYGLTGVQTNPDFIPMMEYCRTKGIIPNFTLSGIDLTDELAVKISKLVGALAVSAYQSDKNVCYNTVKKFTDLGIKQTNIHLMVSQETLGFAMEVLNDRISDPRLKDMNAVVFLGVKGKGRAKDHFHPLSKEQYRQLIQFCMEHKIAFGFDSCSAPKFEAAISAMEGLTEEQRKNLIMCSESCESSLFSAYINVLGEFWMCSFSENAEGVEMVNVLEAKDFLADVWNSPQVEKFRNKLLQTEIKGCRHCPVYPEINE